jgi:RND family efflux transporter MFP subunit
MKSSLSRLGGFFRKRKYIAIGILVVLVGGVFVLASGGRGESIETVEAVRTDVISVVSVTGTVTPSKRIDLGFDQSGVLGNVSVKVGDEVNAGSVIAYISADDVVSSLRGAEAKLRDLSNGLRPEEDAVELAKVDEAKSDLREAERQALNSIRSAYNSVEEAIKGGTDTFFDNPVSSNPEINIRTRGQDEERLINSKRLKTTTALNEWKNDILTFSSSTNISDLIDKSKTHLLVVQDLYKTLSEIIDRLNTSSSGLDDSDVASHVATMNESNSSVNTAVSSVTSAENDISTALSALSVAERQYELKKSGSSSDAISAQEAEVSRYLALLGKTRIVSPINGVVARVEADQGEFVSAGSVLFTVISKDLIIEVDLPEADIAKVNVGNPASITLDAYGEDVVFAGHIAMIDPAETVVEGVPTYTVTIVFDTQDARIRSGMTANIDIETARKNSVIAIPGASIVSRQGRTFTRIPSEDMKTYTERDIEVGIRGSDGLTEVISGVSEGDRVVTFIKQ